MVICAVAGCSNHDRHQKDLDIKFHRFPRNSEIQLKWINACKRANSFTVGNARVCSVHFDDSDYIRDLKHELLNLPIRRVLRPEAVPHLHFPLNSNGLASQTCKGRGIRTQKRNNRKELSPVSSNEEEMLTVKEEPGWLTVKEEPGLVQETEFPSLKEEPNSEDANFAFEESKNMCDDTVGTEKFKCGKDADEADSQLSPLSSNMQEMLTVKEEPGWLTEKEEPGLVQITEFLSLKGEPSSEDANFALVESKKTCEDGDSAGAEEFQCKKDAKEDDFQDAEMDSDPVESLATAVIKDQPESLQDTNVIRPLESENDKKTNLCPQCDKRFKNRFHLSRHARLAHTENGKYQCTNCDISFSKFFNLKRHWKIHKGMQWVFCCTICNASFTRNELLKRHSMSHNGVKSYKCPVCDSAFTRRENFVQHQQIHTGGKPFECNTCNSSFRWRFTSLPEVLSQLKDIML
ncbi:uncharacterized protein [Anabrus simplex]|uniref:uncharacterized protein isoform X2 n=1 Tax=Anabrus simplex TaxID=316456 RepID=UPI0035A2BCC5